MSFDPSVAHVICPFCNGKFQKKVSECTHESCECSTCRCRKNLDETGSSREHCDECLEHMMVSHWEICEEASPYTNDPNGYYE